MNSNYKVCAICQKCISNDEDSCRIREKGAAGINKKSDEIGDTLTVEAGNLVHVDCRRDYSKRTLNASGNSSIQHETVRTRLSATGFNYKTDCFFCGVTVTEWEKLNKKSSNVECKNCEVDKVCVRVFVMQ